MAGDPSAREQLVEEIYRPLEEAGLRAAGDAERLSGAGEQPGGRRPDALRPPQHRALPAPTCDRRHRLVTLRCTLGVHAADRADPGASGRREILRPSLLSGTYNSPVGSSSLSPRAAGAVHKRECESARTRRSRPRRPDARLPDSLARTPRCRRPRRRVVGRHRARPCPLRHARPTRTRSATRRSRSRCWSPRVCCPPRAARRRRARGAVAGPQRRRDHRRRVRRRALDDTAALTLVRRRGLAMAEAAAVTETGMSALLGGDPDVDRRRTWRSWA